MTGKGGDYDGWILRLLEKPEDILHSYVLQEWLEFATEKIEAYSGHSVTQAQIEALTDYRNRAFELPQEIGIGIKEVTIYRDAKGRFSKEPTERATKRIVYRGERNKFIKRDTATMMMIEELEARGIRKRKKQ